MCSREASGSTESSIDATRPCAAIRESGYLRAEIPGLKAASIGLESCEAALEGGCGGVAR